MAKRLSQLERGIRSLEDQIRDLSMEVRGLERARDHLVLQRVAPSGPAAVPRKPIRRVKGDPLRVEDAAS